MNWSTFAWRNLWRNKRRTVLTMAMIGVAAFASSLDADSEGLLLLGRHRVRMIRLDAETEVRAIRQRRSKRR